MKNKRLYIFDMDGTLIPFSTAATEIARQIGHLSILEEMEDRLKERKIHSEEFARSVHELWQELSEEAIEKAFYTSPKLKNIKPVLNDIHAKGGVSCLITMSGDFFANRFYEYGFDYIYASSFFNIKRKSLHLNKILKPENKPEIAEQLSKKLNLNFSQSIAFGDSYSDVPLFQKLTYTVSVNGDPRLNTLSRYHYRGLDLMEAYSLVNEQVEKEKIIEMTL